MSKKSDIKKKIVKKRNTTLESFLSQYVIKRGSTDQIEASHTSMGPPFGKYYIPDEKLSKFHNIYHHHVFDNKLDCHLVERHQNIGPIIIDLDFKYKIDPDNNTPQRLYTTEIVEKFLILYFQEMVKVLVLDKNEEHLTHRLEDLRSAFVFEKKKPSINPKKK